tara:strand:- start:211 stop:546 length:336 start_codon:yes stop_codon:yes gene_type:complete
MWNMLKDEFDTCKVRAWFEMLEANASGWSTPVKSGLRPNHNFWGPDNRDMCMGQIELIDDGQILPGEKKQVIINFLGLSEFISKLEVGFRWRIQAGSQYFANGEVIEIIEN